MCIEKYMRQYIKYSRFGYSVIHRIILEWLEWNFDKATQRAKEEPGQSSTRTVNPQRSVFLVRLDRTWRDNVNPISTIPKFFYKNR